MLLNKGEKIAVKIIQVTMIALVAAMLSSFYISKVEAANFSPDEIKIPGTLPDKAGNFDSLK